MVKFHTGYKLRETDFKDVSALCARFGTDYPEEYASLDMRHLCLDESPNLR